MPRTPSSPVKGRGKGLSEYIMLKYTKGLKVKGRIKLENNLLYFRRSNKEACAAPGPRRTKEIEQGYRKIL